MEKRVAVVNESRIDFDSVQRAFMDTWNIEVEQERMETFSRRGIYVESRDGPAENGESEWLVFESEKDANEEALLRVRQDLEEEPEIFNKSFIQQYYKISDTDRRIIANEEADFRIEDMEEEDIAHEAGVLRQWEDAVDSGDTAKAEGIIEKAKEKVHDEIYKEWYNGLKDPVAFLVNDQGIYSLSDLSKAKFISIDVEKASADAIKADGVAHFLDQYDGEEEEITDPKKRKTFIVYGVN